MVDIKKRNIPQNTAVYTTLIDRFNGVDLTQTELNVANKRSPDAMNLITSSIGKVEKRPAWEYHTFAEGSATMSGKINGYYEYSLTSGDYAFIHSGTKLYIWAKTPNTLTEIQHKDGGLENPTATTLTLNNAKSKIYGLDNKVYILDGKDIYVIEQLDPTPSTFTYTTSTRTLPQTITLSEPLHILNSYITFTGSSNDYDVFCTGVTFDIIANSTVIGTMTAKNQNTSGGHHIDARIQTLRCYENMQLLAGDTIKITQVSSFYADASSLPSPAFSSAGISISIQKYPVTATKLNTNYLS